MDYDQTDIAERYQTARAMPAASFEQWLTALARHVPAAEVSSLLDLGYGTGRFRAALGERFQARVFGVDPSAKMLAKARAGAERPDLSFLEGRAEAIPLDDDACDLAFLSMVYHHIEDPAAAARELRRVLRPGGTLAIRQSTRDHLETFEFERFFPEAKAILESRIPAVRDLIERQRAAGFTLAAHDVLRHRLADGFEGLVEKIAQRACSDLAAISDQAFAAGLARLGAVEAPEAREALLTVSIDLLVFRAPDAET